MIFEGSIGAMAAVLVEQLDRAGIDRRGIRQWVVTHAHPDHVMAVPRLREMLPGLSVIASEKAARTLASEKAVAFFSQIDDQLTASMLEKGTIDNRHRPAPLGQLRIAIDRVVREGDSIRVGGLAFQVLETPGHSECSLSFYEPAEKILVVSDATGYYMPDEQAWWPNYFSGYGDYLRSMERLAGLETEVLCLSHNGVVCGAENVRSYFRDAIAATQAYHERILQETRADKPGRQLALELGEEIHEKTGVLPLDFFQKNCGLLIKLSLKHEGIG